MMRRPLIAGVAAAATIGLLVSPGSAPARATTVVHVSYAPPVVVQNTSFTPAVYGFRIGNGPTFQFRNTVPQTTTSNQGFWSSPREANGQSYSLVIASAGTYRYHSATHPTVTGTLNVMPTAAPQALGLWIQWYAYPIPYPSSVHWVGGTGWAVQYRRHVPGAPWVTWASHAQAVGQYFRPPTHGYYDIRAFTWNGPTVHSAWSPNLTVYC